MPSPLDFPAAAAAAKSLPGAARPRPNAVPHSAERARNCLRFIMCTYSGSMGADNGSGRGRGGLAILEEQDEKDEDEGRERAGDEPDAVPVVRSVAACVRFNGYAGQPRTDEHAQAVGQEGDKPL